MAHTVTFSHENPKPSNDIETKPAKKEDVQTQKEEKTGTNFREMF